MTAKHTPGPWQLRFGTGDQFDFLLDDGIGAPIAYWAHHKRVKPAKTKAEAKANARLIAAAPTLLEVLQELEESSSYWSEYDVPLGIVERIKSAIVRATGVNK